MKTQTKWIIGGVALTGIAGLVIYLATRPKAAQIVAGGTQGAVQGGIQGGLQQGATSPPPNATSDVEKQQGQLQPPPPQVQLPQKNPNQI